MSNVLWNKEMASVLEIVCATYIIFTLATMIVLIFTDIGRFLQDRKFYLEKLKQERENYLYFKNSSSRKNSLCAETEEKKMNKNKIHGLDIDRETCIRCNLHSEEPNIMICLNKYIVLCLKCIEELEKIRLEVYKADKENYL